MIIHNENITRGFAVVGYLVYFGVTQPSVWCLETYMDLHKKKYLDHKYHHHSRDGL